MSCIFGKVASARLLIIAAGQRGVLHTRQESSTTFPCAVRKAALTVAPG